MFRYFKEAFLARPVVPGLGRVPANLLALGGAGILGFGHPSFWLLGLGLEAGYLVMLATNKRFQNVVDAVEKYGEGGSADATDDEQLRQSLARQLIPPDAARLKALEDRCRDALRLMREAGVDDYLMESNRDGLKRLTWIFLKLLVAQKHMRAGATADPAELTGKIATLDQELASPRLSTSLRESKKATRAILDQRLANVARRAQTLDEIESDLTRIEAQVTLAQENASMRDKPQVVSADIDLLTGMNDFSVFGSDESAVASLDRSFSPMGTTASPTTEGNSNAASPMRE